MTTSVNKALEIVSITTERQVKYCNIARNYTRHPFLTEQQGLEQTGRMLTRQNLGRNHFSQSSSLAVGLIFRMR